MGLWTNPKFVESWITKQKNHKLQCQVTIFTVGKGLYVFIFVNKLERDLIFRAWWCFKGTIGLFISPSTLDFSPNFEITFVPAWIWIPRLPLHLQGPGSLKEIGNKLHHYMDKAKPKRDKFSSVRLCVEVNLSKGLLKAIKINLGDQSHMQELDYEKIQFKCIIFHSHGNFAKNCHQQ